MMMHYLTELVRFYAEPIRESKTRPLAHTILQEGFIPNAQDFVEAERIIDYLNPAWINEINFKIYIAYRFHCNRDPRDMSKLHRVFTEAISLPGLPRSALSFLRTYGGRP